MQIYRIVISDCYTISTLIIAQLFFITIPYHNFVFILRLDTAAEMLWIHATGKIRLALLIVLRQIK